MYKKLLLWISISFIFLYVNTASAQFPNVKKLRSAVQSATGVSMSGLTSSKTSSINTYLASTRELSLSLEKAAEAFGVKDEVLKKLAMVKSLKEGNINDKELTKARKASEEAYEIIKQKAAEAKAPSIESKKLMAESIVHLVSGIQKERELVGSVQNLSSQAQAAVSNVSPMEIMKVKGIVSTALTLVKAIPMDLKLTKGILSFYMQYAKANNIEIPGNATGLLKGE